MNGDELREAIGEIRSDLGYLKRGIDRLEAQSVTRVEFEPVKKVVYGTVATILLAVLVAVIAAVVPV